MDTSSLMLFQPHTKLPFRLAPTSSPRRRRSAMTGVGWGWGSMCHSAASSSLRSCQGLPALTALSTDGSILAKGVKLHSDTIAVVAATTGASPLWFHIITSSQLPTSSRDRLRYPHCAGEETEAQVLNDWSHPLIPKKPPDDETEVMTPAAHLVFHSLCSGSTARCPCPERTAARPTC